MKNNRLALSALRLNAFLIAFGTLATLAFAKELDPVRSPFLVPDLVLSAWLMIASVLPRTLAVPALLSGFGISVGILGVAAMSQFASAGVGPGLASGLIGATVGLVASIWLCLKHLPVRAYPPF